MTDERETWRERADYFRDQMAECVKISIAFALRELQVTLADEFVDAYDEGFTAGKLAGARDMRGRAAKVFEDEAKRLEEFRLRVLARGEYDAARVMLADKTRAEFSAASIRDLPDVGDVKEENEDQD